MSFEIERRRIYSSGTIFRMAVPLMLSFLLEQLIGMTDVAFLGRVGEVELGAAALAGVFFLMLMMFGMGYGFGVQAHMSRKNGEKAWAEIGRSFRSGVLFLTGLAAVLIVLSDLAAKPFLDTACESAAVAEAADTYLYWRVWGLPFAFACALLRAFFIATLRPGVLTASSLVMVASNFVLNYVLIFGAGPVPAMGIAGAAIASTISEAVCLVFLLGYVLLRVDHGKYALFGSFSWDGALQRSLFRLGRWLMVQEAFAFFAWLLFFLAVEHLGEEPLAVSNIVRQICSTLFLFIHAFGSTCGAVAANLIGEGREDEVPGLVRRGLVLCAVSMLPVMLLAAVFPSAVLGVFTSIEGVISAANATFYVMLGSFLTAVPAMYLLFVMGGIGRTWESSVASLGRLSLLRLHDHAPYDERRRRLDRGLDLLHHGGHRAVALLAQGRLAYALLECSLPEGACARAVFINLKAFSHEGRSGLKCVSPKLSRPHRCAAGPFQHFNDGIEHGSPQHRLT